MTPSFFDFGNKQHFLPRMKLLIHPDFCLQILY